MKRSICIGYDPREAEAFGVCRHSIRRFAPDIPVHAIELGHMREAGLYTRPTSVRDGRMWDDISGAPCSTEFAISRFLSIHIADSEWVLFMDSDVLALGNVAELFALADPKYAVMCVKHRHEPPLGVKMDGQLQTLYKRKNWSSVCLWQKFHPSNRKLTVELINSIPGRELHAYSWLADDEIGELSPEWNYLVGHTKLPEGKTPKLVHFTEGIPSFAGYENVEYADAWRDGRRSWLTSRRRQLYAQEGSGAGFTAAL